MQKNQFSKMKKINSIFENIEMTVFKNAKKIITFLKMRRNKMAFLKI